MDLTALEQQQQQVLQSQQQSEQSQAYQACSSCRKQKRKCDKQLPSCSLCIRIGRPCDYRTDTQNPIPSSEDFAALRQQVSDLEQILRSSVSNGTPFVSASNGTSSSNSATLSLNGHSDPSNFLSPAAPTAWPIAPSFPSLFFLDSNAFEYSRAQIQAPYVKVPPGALTALGNSVELRATIEHYFRTVHLHFPIISKIRLYQHLANPLNDPGADVALLFMAMKLACTAIPEGMPPQTQLYQDVKSFYHFVEAQNGFSVQLMQALLLLALYEIGHAIYPAAYLTIGNSARLGHAMGLHGRLERQKVPQILPHPITWTEQEERRRVWWTVIILDRFVNIGHRGKPFATNDPNLETNLPTDDASWDRGQMLVAAPLSLSASQTIKVAPFARICQAAHLLGKITRHLDDASLPAEYKISEAHQLKRTMRALADVLPHEIEESESPTRPTLCTSLGICYSGLLTLYDAYSCPERNERVQGEEQLVLQKDCIDGLKIISARVVELGKHIRQVVESGAIDQLSPMVIDCLYQGAANYAWYVRESSDPTCRQYFDELKELLALLEERWKVAGQYLYHCAVDLWADLC